MKNQSKTECCEKCASYGGLTGEFLQCCKEMCECHRPQDTELSQCCKAPFHVECADEGTSHYECDKCGNACDPFRPQVIERGIKIVNKTDINPPIIPKPSESEFITVKVKATGHSSSPLNMPSSERCKHDVHGTDCYKCFPSESKCEESELETLLWQFANNVTDREGEVCSAGSEDFRNQSKIVKSFIAKTLASQQEKYIKESNSGSHQLYRNIYEGVRQATLSSIKERISIALSYNVDEKTKTRIMNALEALLDEEIK